jgi:hypothetical protein
MSRQGVDCPKCGHHFRDTSKLKAHLGRKTPCAPILEKEDLPAEKRDNPHNCKFCGRTYSRADALTRHLKKSCKIVPREGNEEGMEKLYEHVLRKQQRQIEELKTEMAFLKAAAAATPTALITAIGLAEEKQPVATLATPPVANAAGQATSMCGVNIAIDKSIGKTTNNITTNVTINVFGQEKLDRITRPQVIDLLRGLGPVGENVKTIAEKAIIHAAMLIFSDPAHPEDITCYLPNKKGDDALVHGESGWEVQPVGLVISPMAAQSIDALFKNQPAPDQHTPEKDVKWMMEECGNIMRYIQQHENDMTNEPPRGEMRGILIRNKELLQRVLAKLPMGSSKPPL